MAAGTLDTATKTFRNQNLTSFAAVLVTGNLIAAESHSILPRIPKGGDVRRDVARTNPNIYTKYIQYIPNIYMYIYYIPIYTYQIYQVGWTRVMQSWPHLFGPACSSIFERKVSSVCLVVTDVHLTTKCRLCADVQ